MKTISVFIASPSDVEAERSFAYEAVMNLSPIISKYYNYGLMPVSWTEFAPIASSDPNKVFQDRINQRIEICGVFIGILYRRYGTNITKTRTISGTEEEFNIAIKNREKLKILTYFRYPNYKKIKNLDKQIINQLDRLNTLKKYIESSGLAYQQYKKPSDFKNRIMLDILEAIMEIVTESSRCYSLKSFFKFNPQYRQSEPSVYICYPAIHKHHFSSAQSDYNWQKRLLPNVVYEDFKTVQKIQVALNFIGIIDNHAITISQPAAKMNPGNRIWLCIPRNELAQMKLKELSKQVRFKFVENKKGERYIEWKNNNSDQVNIFSPLRKYLRFNSKRPAGMSAWKSEYGDIIARDYAIISRFVDKKFTGNRGVPFYHYFFAGIRGLGTWGVGWYIDRLPEELSRLADEAPGEDIQALLEVTFKNNRIISVTDVSSEDQDYFDEQNSDSYIKNNISNL